MAAKVSWEISKVYPEAFQTSKKKCWTKIGDGF